MWSNHKKHSERRKHGGGVWCMFCDGGHKSIVGRIYQREHV